LDTLKPLANTALLSAQEAKERLREIVEGFFFWRHHEQGQPSARHLLVKTSRPVIAGAIQTLHLRQIGLAPQLTAP
jgi:hypothetical protein